jgi:hypothetical protein
MSKNKHSTPKKPDESWRFCRERRPAFSRTSQTSIYRNTDRQTRTFYFLSRQPNRVTSISKLLAFQTRFHMFRRHIFDDIFDSGNISGNLDLARKSLKLASKSLCRVRTYVNLIKYHKSYARHRQMYKDAATSTDDDCVSCKSLIHYSCCNQCSARKTKYCVSS